MLTIFTNKIYNYETRDLTANDRFTKRYIFKHTDDNYEPVFLHFIYDETGTSGDNGTQTAHGLVASYIHTGTNV
jgi:hypothetical protein